MQVVFCPAVFDESGHFILYATMLGVKGWYGLPAKAMYATLLYCTAALSSLSFAIHIKLHIQMSHLFPVINLTTNRCMLSLGRLENARFLTVAMFQGSAKKPKAAVTMEMEASENPVLQEVYQDPMLFCTALKKNRFYLFSRRNPEDTQGWGLYKAIIQVVMLLQSEWWHWLAVMPGRNNSFCGGMMHNMVYVTAVAGSTHEWWAARFMVSYIAHFSDSDRDVFNEKPSKEELVAATKVSRPLSKEPQLPHKCTVFIFTLLLKSSANSSYCCGSICQMQDK